MLDSRHIEPKEVLIVGDEDTTSDQALTHLHFIGTYAHALMPDHNVLDLDAVAVDAGPSATDSRRANDARKPLGGHFVALPKANPAAPVRTDMRTNRTSPFRPWRIEG